MRFMSRSRASFWPSFRVLHAANKVRCSSVNSAGVFPSEKNCDKVIPNARHTASRVGMVGALLRLKRFVDGGLGKAGFFVNPVVCPSPFIHKVFYMLYYIYAISICIYFKEREAVGGGV